MSNMPNSPVNPDPRKAAGVSSGMPVAGGAAGAPAGGTKKAAGKKDEPSDASLAGVIDTIEAIIIALIVALTFRAFIVEAFVIPTGSMAPTLLGAHFQVICPKCGYEFDRNASLTNQAQLDPVTGKLVIPAGGNGRAELGPNSLVPCEDQAITCPNCRYEILPKDLPQWLASPEVIDRRNNDQRHVMPFAWANNGDRILVLKYLYSVLPPKRWDVIVFKEPEHARDNFIKRLIGRPGETVQIVNGDVYIGPPGNLDPKDRQIARKPEEIQRFLWQLVYDNDHYPTDEGQPRAATPPWINPWAPPLDHAAGWTKGTTMAYDGPGAGALVFHSVPAGMPAGFPPYGLNTLGYNNDMKLNDFSVNSEFAPLSIVGDLRLETLWTPRAGAAADIALTLGRPNNCFQVRWNAQGLALARFNPATGVFDPVAATTTRPVGPPQAGKSYRLALHNVDHAVGLDIEGERVLRFAEPWNVTQAIADLARYPADWSNARGAEAAAQVANTIIRIDVDGPCTLSHLKLFRDLYYTQVSPEYDLAQRRGIRSTAMQDNPLTLKDDEFFAMGDNSRQSSDGRLWMNVYDPLGDLALRRGIVPRRYLLGKAFFVYWPAGFRPATGIPLIRDMPLVPNTGDMRIIR